MKTKKGKKSKSVLKARIDSYNQNERNNPAYKKPGSQQTERKARRYE